MIGSNSTSSFRRGIKRPSRTPQKMADFYVLEESIQSSSALLHKFLGLLRKVRNEDGVINYSKVYTMLYSSSRDNDLHKAFMRLLREFRTKNQCIKYLKKLSRRMRNNKKNSEYVIVVSDGKNSINLKFKFNPYVASGKGDPSDDIIQQIKIIAFIHYLKGELKLTQQ